MLKDNKDFLLEDKEAVKRKTSSILSKEQVKIAKIALSCISIIAFTVLLVFFFNKCVEIGVLYFEDTVTEEMLKLDARNSANYQALLTENAVLTIEIQELNQEILNLSNNLTTLNGAIDVFSLEVASLGSSINFIDTSVATSIAVQEDMGNKIQALQARIEELKASLKVLSEAP